MSLNSLYAEGLMVRWLEFEKLVESAECGQIQNCPITIKKLNFICLNTHSCQENNKNKQLKMCGWGTSSIGRAQRSQR